jgi:hypothetical protein
VLLVFLRPVAAMKIVILVTPLNKKKNSSHQYAKFSKIIPGQYLMEKQKALILDDWEIQKIGWKIRLCKSVLRKQVDLCNRQEYTKERLWAGKQVGLQEARITWKYI